MSHATGWTGWLEGTALAVAMRHWAWLYPITEIAHIVGFAVLVGAAIMFDLRLLGVSSQLPVIGMARHLLPWARASLVLVIPSGLMMFTAHADEFAGNPVFRLKLALIATAGLNAAVFHQWSFGSVARWDREVGAPWPAKVSAVLSLVLWPSVISCGRLLAYF